MPPGPSWLKGFARRAVIAQGHDGLDPGVATGYDCHLVRLMDRYVVVPLRRYCTLDSEMKSPLGKDRVNPADAPRWSIALSTDGVALQSSI